MVEGERIAAVGGDLSAVARDAETVMAAGLCLAPGLVDMRVQLREPGAEHMESIETGGHAAAAGAGSSASFPSSTFTTFPSGPMTKVVRLAMPTGR